MAEKRLFKEYNQLLKTPVDSTNQIISLSPVDASSNILEWNAIIAKPTKEDSKYYYNGQWTLDISVDKGYPNKPPSVKFNKRTPINHPNVRYDNGEICLDILKSENWSPAWNLQYIVMAILLLLDEPEPDSPFNVDSAILYREDKVAFESIVQYFIWKNNTFYTGGNNDENLNLKHSSGIKIIEGVALDDFTTSSIAVSNDGFKALHQIEEDAEEIRDEMEKEDLNLDKYNKNISKKEQMPENQVTDDNNKFTFEIPIRSPDRGNESNSKIYSPRPINLERSLSNIKIIHDVAEQVTKQFIEKVDEIGNLNESSNSSAEPTSEDDLDNFKQKVAQNVSRQVEQLCSQSASPIVLSPMHKNSEEEESQESFDSKQRFLKQVNDEINEVRKRQQQENVPPLCDKPSTGILSTAPRVKVRSMLDVDLTPSKSQESSAKS